MRINIFKAKVDGKFLADEAEKFEAREAMRPYLIMSSQTLNSLANKYKKEIVDLDNGQYEFFEYKILLNADLTYGEVDIR